MVEARIFEPKSFELWDRDRKEISDDVRRSSSFGSMEVKFETLGAKEREC